MNFGAFGCLSYDYKILSYADNTSVLRCIKMAGSILRAERSKPGRHLEIFQSL